MISTQRGDLLLPGREEQQFLNQELRMDNSRDNELIVLRSNWSGGFSEVYRTKVGCSDGYQMEREVMGRTLRQTIRPYQLWHPRYAK